jgi:D-aminopeptidase
LHLHQAVPPQGRFAVGVVGQKVRVSRLEQGDVPEPFIVDLPVLVRIEFAKSSQADRAALVPGLRREGTRVNFQAEEMLSAYNTFRAAVELAG